MVGFNEQKVCNLHPWAHLHMLYIILYRILKNIFKKHLYSFEIAITFGHYKKVKTSCFKVMQKFLNSIRIAKNSKTCL